MTAHAANCRLNDVHSLRHAITAVGLLLKEPSEVAADRVSAMALADALAHFAELSDWATVTLKDVAEHATLMDSEQNRERFKHQCNCGVLGA